MIEEKQLYSGRIFSTDQKKPIHKQFYIYQADNGLWYRASLSFGPITGNYSTSNLLKFLNKYKFELIGEMKIHMYEEYSEQLKLKESEFKGAL